MTRMIKEIQKKFDSDFPSMKLDFIKLLRMILFSESPMVIAKLKELLMVVRLSHPDDLVVLEKEREFHEEVEKRSQQQLARKYNYEMPRDYQAACDYEELQQKKIEEEKYTQSLREWYDRTPWDKMWNNYPGKS